MHGSVCSMPSIEVWRVHDATNKPQRAVPSCWKEALGERTPNKARRSLARLMRCFDFWLNWVTYGCFLFNAVGDHFGFKLRKKKKKKTYKISYTIHCIQSQYYHDHIYKSTKPNAGGSLASQTFLLAAPILAQWVFAAAQVEFTFKTNGSWQISTIQSYSFALVQSKNLAI